MSESKAEMRDTLRIFRDEVRLFQQLVLGFPPRTDLQRPWRMNVEAPPPSYRDINGPRRAPWMNVNRDYRTPTARWRAAHRRQPHTYAHRVTWRSRLDREEADEW